MAIKVGIIGTTGYAGEFLVRILLRHPEAELAWCTSSHAAGKKLSEVLPSFSGLTDLILKEENPEAAADACDCVFVAKKSVESMKYAPILLEKGVKVIDIGGEFRLKDPDQYKKWYGNEHTAPGLCARAVYGLVEYNREKIKTADLVSNPGCYPTTAILPLKPLVYALGNKVSSVNISSSSGVTGAGRTASSTGINLFVNCFNSHSAYKAGKHRHTPEIEQEIGASVTFVPQLASIDRGILTVAYLNLKEGEDPGDVSAVLRETYSKEQFIRVYDRAEDVTAAGVRGTNFCDMHAVYIKRSHTVCAVSAIDNLIKGASGQAVQNMNVMFGIDEGVSLAGESY